MKITCEKCSKSIQSDLVNIEKSIYHCTNCDEFFQLQDVFEEQKKSNPVTKPSSTKVKLLKSVDRMEIKLPSKGLKASSWFMVVWLIGWNGVSFGILPSAINDNEANIWLVSLFPLIGICVLIGFIYSIKNKSLIHINRTSFGIKRTLFGISLINRSFKIEQYEGIKPCVLYTQNDIPIYGLEFQVIGGNNIRFGGELGAIEHKWISYEFNSFITQMKETGGNRLKYSE